MPNVWRYLEENGEDLASLPTGRCSARHDVEYYELFINDFGIKKAGYEQNNIYK